MPERVVVIGGGYAGLAVIGELQQLSRDAADIALIDPIDGHELIPELPEALRDDDPIEEHIVPFREILKDAPVTHIKDSATGINTQARYVERSAGPPPPESRVPGGAAAGRPF
jgi:NADH dehydrogenase FAD-containing subunit